MSEKIELRNETKKEDLGGIKVELLNLKKELSELVYQLLSLYDRWSVEHQHVARREVDMVRLIESFGEEVKQFSKLDEQIRNNIQATTTKAAILVGKTVADETKKLFESKIDGMSQKLQATVERAEWMANRFEKIEMGASMKVWAIVVLSCLLIGFIGGTLSDWFKKAPAPVRQYSR